MRYHRKRSAKGVLLHLSLAGKLRERTSGDLCHKHGKSSTNSTSHETKRVLQGAPPRGRQPREASTFIFKIRSCVVRSGLKNRPKTSRKCLIFKIRSYRARSDLKNKSPRFSANFTSLFQVLQTLCSKRQKHPFLPSLRIFLRLLSRNNLARQIITSINKNNLARLFLGFLVA